MVDALELASVAPSVEMALNSAVRRERVGQRPPLAAGPEKIKDRVEKPAQSPFSQSPRRRRFRKQRRDQSPRLVADQGLAMAKHRHSFVSNGGVGHNWRLPAKQGTPVMNPKLPPAYPGL
jgi:hypothetical protein